MVKFHFRCRRAQCQAVHFCLPAFFQASAEYSEGVVIQIIPTWWHDATMVTVLVALSAAKYSHVHVSEFDLCTSSEFDRVELSVSLTCIFGANLSEFDL